MDMAELIRAVEIRLAEEYPKGEIRSPLHLSLGQEKIAVDVCSHLRKQDLLVSYYRNHHWYLAKGGDLKRLIAEIYGKTIGCSGGRGGSMHVIDKDAGVFGTSAIVGAQLAHACGAALAIKMRGEDRIVCCVFGDGATDEGAFYEAMHFAGHRKLPIWFICMNDNMAVNTRKEDRTDVDIRRVADACAVELEDYFFNAHRQATVRRPTLSVVRAGRTCIHVGPTHDLEPPVTDPEIIRLVDDAFAFAKLSASAHT